MSLSINNLHVSLAGKEIIHDLSLDCQAGEFIALCGPNGAGKSTLLKTITGEVPYQQGEILLQGKSISCFNTKELALTRAVLPQHIELAFPFSVHEVISMALIFTAETAIKKRIMQEVIASLSLEAFVDRDYSSLSGGEKQRVQLARVIAQLLQPKSQGQRFLLLDECTSAMDMAWMHKAFALLKRYTKKDIGIIAVVHDMNLASLYADKIVLLSQHKTYFQGPPHSVVKEDIIDNVFSTTVSVIPHPLQEKPVIIQQALAM